MEAQCCLFLYERMEFGESRSCSMIIPNTECAAIWGRLEWTAPPSVTSTLSKSLRNALFETAESRRARELLSLIRPDPSVGGSIQSGLLLDAHPCLHGTHTPVRLLVIGANAARLATQATSLLSIAGGMLGDSSMRGVLIGTRWHPYSLTIEQHSSDSTNGIIHGRSAALDRQIFHADELTLEFQSPCVHPRMTAESLAAHAALSLLRTICAYSNACDSSLESSLIEHVRGTFCDVEEEADLGPKEHAELRSSSNGHRYQYYGRRGRIIIRGATSRVAPWLRLLLLMGAGGRRSMGMGQVRLGTPEV